MPVDKAGTPLSLDVTTAWFRANRLHRTVRKSDCTLSIILTPASASRSVLTPPRSRSGSGKPGRRKPRLQGPRRCGGRLRAEEGDARHCGHGADGEPVPSGRWRSFSMAWAWAPAGTPVNTTRSQSLRRSPATAPKCEPMPAERLDRFIDKPMKLGAAGRTDAECVRDGDDPPRGLRSIKRGGRGNYEGVVLLSLGFPEHGAVVRPARH